MRPAQMFARLLVLGMLCMVLTTEAVADVHPDDIVAEASVSQVDVAPETMLMTSEESVMASKVMGMLKDMMQKQGGGHSHEKVHHLHHYSHHRTHHRGHYHHHHYRHSHRHGVRHSGTRRHHEVHRARPHRRVEHHRRPEEELSEDNRVRHHERRHERRHEVHHARRHERHHVQHHEQRHEQRHEHHHEQHPHRTVERHHQPEKLSEEDKNEMQMENKVLAMVNTMMQKKAEKKRALKQKAQKERRDRAAAVHKHLNKVAEQVHHKVHHKPKPHIRHVKNGVAMLRGLVQKTEKQGDFSNDTDRKKRAHERHMKGERHRQQKQKQKQKKKQKVDLVEEALNRAARKFGTKASREAKHKQKIKEELDKASHREREEEEDEEEEDWDDHLPIAAPKLHIKPGQVEPLSEKGATLLASLLKNSNDDKKSHKKPVHKSDHRKPEHKKVEHGHMHHPKKRHHRHEHRKEHRKAKSATLVEAEHERIPTGAKLPVVHHGAHHRVVDRHRHHRHHKHERHHTSEHQKRKPRKDSLVDKVLKSALTQASMHSLLNAADPKTQKPEREPKRQHKRQHKKKVHHSRFDKNRLSEESAFSDAVEKNMAKEKNTKVERRKEDEEYIRRMRTKQLEREEAKRKKEALEMASITKREHINHNHADKKAGKMVKKARKQLKNDIAITQDDKPQTGSDEDSAAAALAAKLFKKLGGKAVSASDLKAVVQHHVQKHVRRHHKQAPLKKKASHSEHKKIQKPALVEVSAAQKQKMAKSIMADLKLGVVEEKKFLNMQ